MRLLHMVDKGGNLIVSVTTFDRTAAGWTAHVTSPSELVG